MVTKELSLLIVKVILLSLIVSFIFGLFMLLYLFKIIYIKTFKIIGIITKQGWKNKSQNLTDSPANLKLKNEIRIKNKNNTIKWAL